MGKKPKQAQRHPEGAGVSSRPGEIASTPFVVRPGGRVFDSPRFHDSPLKRKTKGPLIARVQHIKDLKKQMPPDTGKLVEGLLDAYAKLLQATHAGECRSRKGTRSLMSTCLQKMPSYIELEEYFAELDKEEAGDDEARDRDITDEIYTHLQHTFEVSAGQGWDPFREVVRAHATSLMCDAFADGVLGEAALQAVVVLCGEASAWQEAEKLLWTFLPNLKPLPTPSSLGAALFEATSVSVFMHLAEDLVIHTGRHGFLYDLLEEMISRELLPLEWLATNSMRPVLSRLLRTICEGDNRTFAHAVRFLHTMTYAAIGLPDDSVLQGGEVDIVLKQLKPSARRDLRSALDLTLSNMLHLLASTSLAYRGEVDSTEVDIAQPCTWVLDSLAIGLLSRDDVRSDLELLDTTTENMQTFAQRASWAVMASCLAHLGGSALSSGLVSLKSASLLQALNWVSYQYSCHDIDTSSLLATLPEFIATTARYVGKTRKDDGFTQLQSLVSGLLSLHGIRLPHKLWSLKRLALETSMDFAQHTNDSAHFAYARQIEQLMSSKGRVVLMHSPQKDDTPTAPRGFRLEEGIGEWVPCTPFPTKNGASTGQLPSPSPSGSDDEDIGQRNMYSDSPVLSRGCRIVNAATGKRARASSPMVVIRAKRIQLTPPGSASSSSLYSIESVPIYSELPEEYGSSTQSGPRRSGRAKKQLSDTTRTRRSLRALGPRNYAQSTEETSDEEEEEGSSDEDSDDDAGETRATRSRGKSVPTSMDRPRKRRGRPKKHSTTRSLPSVEQADTANPSETEDERDELGKTPLRKSTRLRVAVISNQNSKGRRTRPARLRQWALQVTNPNTDADESEDELSFY
jgi:hypothetical protein